MNRLILALLLAGTAIAAPPPSFSALGRRMREDVNTTLFTISGGIPKALNPSMGVDVFDPSNKVYLAARLGASGIDRATALTWCQTEAPVLFPSIGGPWYLMKINDAEEDAGINNFLGGIAGFDWTKVRMWTAGFYDPPFRWDPFYNPWFVHPYSSFAPSEPSLNNAGVAFQAAGTGSTGHMYTHALTDELYAPPGRFAGMLCAACQPGSNFPLQDNCMLRPSELLE